MSSKGTPKQEIAVFGESGSGKTVLLSSFCGAAQEPHFLQESLFDVVADDVGQGNNLHQNYLGMKNTARLPEPNRFSAKSYSFSVKLKDGPDAKASKSAPFDALKLVWHDYPGEWFEQDVSGPEEGKRKVAAFKSLLGSDVALLLVDGQRLTENPGEEERYLKSLLSNYRTGILRLKDDLLDEGKPLARFPRIWVLALSKSDLLPGMNVYSFRDLLIEKAAGDIEELRKVLAELVEDSEALAVGQDFVLLSSATFGAKKIEVTKRVGLNLILPLAAVFPFEKYAKWAGAKKFGGKALDRMLGGTEGLAAMLGGPNDFAAQLLGKVKLPGPIGKVIGLIGSDQVIDAAKVAGDALQKLNRKALAKHDYLTATLTQFKIELDESEKEQLLLRGK